MATATVKVEQISGSASKGNARGHEVDPGTDQKGDPAKCAGGL